MRFLSKTNIDFISKQKITGFLSIALIVAGIASLIMKGGPLLSIDFQSGTLTQLQFEKNVKLIFEKPVNISVLRVNLDNCDSLKNKTEIVELERSEEVLVKSLWVGHRSELIDSLKKYLGTFEEHWLEVVDISIIRSNLKENGFNVAEVVEFGEPEDIKITTEFYKNSSDLKDSLKKYLDKDFITLRTESVGPKIGKELQTDALKAIGLALLLILIYITFRFDRYYALGSVMALIHDVLITLGVFSLLDYEINLSVIAAFLTIVGYSLNDTIVVFDRIRENIPKLMKKPLDDIVNISLNETLNRTVITSLTTMMVVVILFLWGGKVINLFAFALIIGVFVGTYSSLFVASPVMVYFEKRSAGPYRK